MEGGEGFEPSVYIYGSGAAFPPVVAGRAPPDSNTKQIIMTNTCRPVHRYLVSCVEGCICELSGAVAHRTLSAGLPWVHSGPTALVADYRFMIIVTHGLLIFLATLRSSWLRFRGKLSNDERLLRVLL